jgi:CPA2 family monovalent cation:H+ antiporter-2
MHGHEAELLTTTFLMLSAIGCGLVLKLVKQPPLVGYILAGLFIGPSGMGLIDYSAEISSLAELGIILLLFIIGMELSVKAFLTVVRPAVIAASLFVSPLWTTVLHYLVVRSKIHLAGEPPAATNLPTQG